MAFVLAARTREFSDTIGTGAIHVTGANSGFQSFTTALATGDTAPCCCVDGAGNWQTFLGTWNETAQTIARTTVYDGSAGSGVLVSFTGERQYVWIYIADRSDNPVVGTTAAFSSLTVGVPSSSGSATFYGPLSGSNRAMYVSQAMVLSGSTNGNVARFETALSGSTTANPGIFTWSLSDNLQASAGVNWSIKSISYGGTSWQGGRNGEWININSTADCTNFGDAFLVAHAPWWRAHHYHNGYPGAERGSLWGTNPLAYAGSSGTIGSRRMRGVQAIEADVGSVYNLFYRTAIRIAEWAPAATSNPGVGRWQDSAFSISQMPSRSLPGFRTIINLGDSLGYWPLQATGATFCEPIVSQVASDPTNQMAIGFMWPGITFTYAPWWSPGAFIGGTGHIGGNTVGGTVLQTVSTVLAKTATVASVTVARGGLHRIKPTLTCSAPPSGGTTATLTVATMGISDPMSMTGATGSRGTGYVVGDVLTLSGGTSTTAGQYTVRAVDSSGQIIDLEATTVGSYSVLPGNPATLTGGTGTGATVAPYWTILTVTVSGAGSGYSEQAPPTITVSGADGDQYQRPLLIPVMTATQTDLSLNPGGSVLIGTQTPASASATGTAGTITWDSNYIYVCTAANTWKRAAIATW